MRVRKGMVETGEVGMRQAGTETQTEERCTSGDPEEKGSKSGPPRRVGPEGWHAVLSTPEKRWAG